jgi:D-psicose/D-tagatose/L-ribulose 3-epimerase
MNGIEREDVVQKLGIHAFVWTGSSLEADLEAATIKAKDAGYELIEFPRLDPTKFGVDSFARRLRELEMGVAVTMGLPWNADVSSEDPATVKRGEALLDDAVAVARDLGATKLGGIIFSAHGKYAALPTRKNWDNSVAVLGRVADRARSSGVTLNLEIVNRFESNLLNTAAQGLAFIRDAGSANIYLHLDTFHMQIEEADPAKAVLMAGDKLGYFHVGESHRGYLGTGTIRFAPIFDALVQIGYDDFVTFESFSSEVVDRDLSITCGIWRNTWIDNSNVVLAKHARGFIIDGLQEARRRARSVVAA